MRLMLLLAFLGLAACGKNTTEQVPTLEQQYIFTDCKAASCKTIMSIGDSISLGYIPHLAGSLKDSYNVYHPQENCRNSYYTSLHIDQWLTEVPTPEVVIWNNGLWNASSTLRTTQYNDEGTWNKTTDAQYEDDLRVTAAKLIATGARVIFVTTTELSPEVADITEQFDVERVADFNAIAASVLPAYGVEVVDLNTVSQSLSGERKDGIHYTSRGSSILADYIINQAGL